MYRHEVVGSILVMGKFNTRCDFSLISKLYTYSMIEGVVIVEKP